MREEVYATANKLLTIEELEVRIQTAKEKGATHFQATFDHDPIWTFEWLRFSREVSEEELKSRRIAQIEKELNGLK